MQCKANAKPRQLSRNRLDLAAISEQPVTPYVPRGFIADQADSLHFVSAAQCIPAHVHTCTHAHCSVKSEPGISTCLRSHSRPLHSRTASFRRCLAHFGGLAVPVRVGQATPHCSQRPGEGRGGDDLICFRRLPPGGCRQLP